MLWYRHDGRTDGSFTWSAGSPSKVGVGWVLSGRGVIYGIETAAAGGRLLWFRHDGSFLWTAHRNRWEPAGLD